MDTTFFTAITLGIAGFVVLGYILWIFFTAITGDTKGLGDKLKIKRKERCLFEADALTKTGNTAEAIAALRQGFIFDQVKSTPLLIDASVNLHLAILSRLISVAERKHSRLDNLAVVEDLVQTRGQLLHGYLNAVRERHTIRKKRAENGKQFPEWAFSEYDRKIGELEDKIRTNRRSLETQVEKLFSALESFEGESGVTYH